MSTVAQTFDQAALNYDQQLQQGLSLSGEAADYFVQGRIAQLQKLLHARACKPQRVLDFGCGIGNAAEELADAFSVAQYVGYDCSAESIEVARGRSDREDCRWTDNAAELAERDFDLVHTSGVFHHIEPHERDQHLQCIRSWLKPGGYFAFFENNPWNPGTQWVMSRIPFDRDAQCLSLLQARSRLQRAGFEIVTQQTLFFLPSSLAMLRPIEPWLQWTPCGAQYLILCRRPHEDQ